MSTRDTDVRFQAAQTREPKSEAIRPGDTLAAAKNQEEPTAFLLPAQRRATLDDVLAALLTIFLRFDKWLLLLAFILALLAALVSMVPEAPRPPFEGWRPASDF